MSEFGLALSAKKHLTQPSSDQNSALSLKNTLHSETIAIISVDPLSTLCGRILCLKSSLQLSYKKHLASSTPKWKLRIISTFVLEVRSAAPQLKLRSTIRVDPLSTHYRPSWCHVDDAFRLHLSVTLSDLCQLRLEISSDFDMTSQFLWNRDLYRPKYFQNKNSQCTRAICQPV